MATADDIQSLGYYAPRQIASGEWIAVQKMLFTTGLFVIDADGAGWRTRFCYEHSIDAVLALLEWDGIGDPPGPWVKEKPSDRHGPGMSGFIKRGTHSDGEAPQSVDAGVGLASSHDRDDAEA